MMFENCWKVVLLAAVIFSGCSSNPPPGGVRLKTFPVKGIVKVDGEPVEGVAIRFHPQGNSAEIKRAVTAGTDATGKISVGTYQSGDGLPVGTYKLTFELPEEEVQVTTAKAKLSRFGERRTVDRLKGAYSNVTKSEIEVTIDKAKTNDLGLIELSTKATSK